MCKVHNSNFRLAKSDHCFLSMRCSAGDPVLLDNNSLACWTNRGSGEVNNRRQNIAQTERTMIQQGWPVHVKEHGISQILHGRGSKTQGLTDLQESLSSSFLFGYSFVSLKPGFLTQRFAHICCHLHALLFPTKVCRPTYLAYGMSDISSMWQVRLTHNHRCRSPINTKEVQLLANMQQGNTTLSCISKKTDATSADCHTQRSKRDKNLESY